MSQSSTPEGVIRNPVDAGHFMALKPARGQVRVSRGGVLLAESSRGSWVLEVGRTMLDPALYLPQADVVAALTRSERRTRCPLKGEASYYSAAGAADLAWAYETPFDFAQDLAGLIAFYADLVVIEIRGGAEG